MSQAAALSLLCVLLGVADAAPANQDAGPLSPKEVQRRWHARMNGRQFVAQLTMRVELGGLLEDRRLTVFRVDSGEDAERVLIRFEAPPTLKGLGLLYLQQTGRPNDYFLYQPAVRRVRRLHESAVTENLYGIDPEFLGLGIASTLPTQLLSMQYVTLEGRPAYRLLERAREASSRFDERTVWLDRESFIPLRTEHRRDGKLVLRAETQEVREIQGIRTPVRMRFERPQDKTRAEVRVEEVDYERKIPAEVFSIFKLTRPSTEDGSGGRF